jgi:peptide-methionine (S)-S-oxide reductase
MGWFTGRAPTLVEPRNALPGRTISMPVTEPHLLSGHSLNEVPAGYEVAVVAMGCFWGAERKFWDPVAGGHRLPDGVWSTSVGYAGGFTPNPTYREVCSGATGHTEVVRIVFDPARIAYSELLRRFWEGHDPTQGMRQGNDVGTQYRSAVYATTAAQLDEAQRSREAFQGRLSEARLGAITSEIASGQTFYFAETYHQQYLIRNPDGYCGLGGTGVACPVGLWDTTAAEPDPSR